MWVCLVGRTLFTQTLTHPISSTESSQDPPLRAFRHSALLRFNIAQLACFVVLSKDSGILGLTSDQVSKYVSRGECCIGTKHTAATEVVE